MERVSFWDNNHSRQDEYDQLYTLVPVEGEAGTVHGELIRCASRLYYDCFNNGNCNVVDVIEGDTGYDDVVINPFFQKMLDYLKEYVPVEVEAVEQFIFRYGSTPDFDEAFPVYDALIVAALNFCAANENRKR